MSRICLGALLAFLGIATLEAKPRHCLFRVHTEANPSDGAKGRRFAIGELMFALAKAYEADAITHEQYFEQTTALVTALGEKEVTTEWIQNQFDWLSENFPNIAYAWKAHPKVMQWLHDLAGFRGQRKRLKRALKLTVVPNKTVAIRPS